MILRNFLKIYIHSLIWKNVESLTVASQEETVDVQNVRSSMRSMLSSVCTFVRNLIVIVINYKYCATISEHKFLAFKINFAFLGTEQPAPFCCFKTILLPVQWIELLAIVTIRRKVFLSSWNGPNILKYLYWNAFFINSWQWSPSSTALSNVA